MYQIDVTKYEPNKKEEHNLIGVNDKQEFFDRIAKVDSEFGSSRISLSDFISLIHKGEYRVYEIVLYVGEPKGIQESIVNRLYTGNDRIITLLKETD